MLSRILLTLTTTLSLCSVSYAQRVELPKVATGPVGSWVVVVPISKEGGEAKWKLSQGLDLVPLDKLFPSQKTAGVVVKADKPGAYQVWAWCAKGDTASDLAVCDVRIGEVPPDSGPGPTPPVSPGPPGMRVLMIYEAKKLSAQPAKREVILYDKSIRDYLQEHCPIDKSGKTKAYRIWPAGVDASQEDEWFRKSLSSEIKDPLWIVIQNGDKSFAGPLPEDVPKTLELLKKYGG